MAIFFIKNHEYKDNFVVLTAFKKSILKTNLKIQEGDSQFIRTNIYLSKPHKATAQKAVIRMIDRFT